MHVGVVLMKEDESLDKTCKVCYYNCSGLKCGLLSRSVSVGCCDDTSCGGGRIPCCSRKSLSYPQTFKVAIVRCPAFLPPIFV